MRRTLSGPLLLLSLAVQQACLRDEVTAPRPAALSAQAMGVSTSRIAFTSSRSGARGDIYVMNPDGSGAVRLTDSPFLDGQASWSPDGRRIAFMSERDAIGVEEPQNIYGMNADGSAQTRLTFCSNDFCSLSNPSWSPDGRQIAFEQFPGFIWVMNADGSAATRLTDGSTLERDPSWSPDGRQIAFTGVDGDREIYVMNADGSAPRKLTNNPFRDAAPAWSPAEVSNRSRAPAHLAFTNQPPATVSVNAAISPAVQVTVTDARGDAVPGGAVRLAIGISPSADATLSGTTVARIVNGVATFTDVRIDRAGQGYTLLAEAGPVSGTSAAFAVVDPGTQLASPSR